MSLIANTNANAVNAEKILVGTLITCPASIDDITISIDELNGVLNRFVFGCIIQMMSQNIIVDVISLSIFAEKKLDAPAKISAYIADLALNYTSVKENLNYYAKLVRDNFLLDEILRQSSKFQAIIEDRSQSADDKLSLIGRNIMDVVDSAVDKANEPALIADLLPRHIEHIEMRVNGDPNVLPTSYPYLDEMLGGGFRTTHLVVIGGRPSMGKTTLGLNVVKNMVLDSSIPCGVLSMEMSRMQLMDKMVADTGSINYGRMRTGKMQEEDYERYALALSRLQDGPLMIDDECGLSMTDIERKARYMKRKLNIRVLLVDYLQMIVGDNAIRQRSDQIEDISRRLKILAKKLDICVIALAQLNRGADKEARPSIAQLRNSGAIEQDADVIIFPYREERDNPDTDKKGLAELIIGKQREGETGVIPFLFDGIYSRFRECPRGDY